MGCTQTVPRTPQGHVQVLQTWQHDAQGQVLPADAPIGSTPLEIDVVKLSGDSLTVKCDAGDTLMVVKQKICEVWDVTWHSQDLYLGEKLLDEQRSLKDQGVGPSSCIQLVVSAYLPREPSTISGTTEHEHYTLNGMGYLD
eukprot:TRINITY_DN54475_c0_g1_i1.p1 TRINITY_DN54475_c0_g1~~TRINITY_DN54475_c0_g1_i1.p1  ORF type:complete len:141 (+),score=19.21 TRINITY_DN54475_c0_g1_i1:39-461(+)